jgi:predicted Zn-dependent peptidase
MTTITTRIGSGAALLMCGATSLLAQAPDRSTPPPLEEPPRLTLPPVQEHTLSNGARVLLMEKHQVPVVQITIIVRAGSAYDPADRIGLASIMADMMDEGAGSRDALELADAIDFLGARIGVGATMHTITASLFTAVPKLDDALPLLADVVLRPTFPEDELERKRVSRLTSLLQAHDEPSTVASVLFAKALFGDHPYGNPRVSTETSLRAITVRDLREFHGAHIKANNATIVVVGDVMPEDILPRLERALGDWEAGDLATPTLAAPAQVARREVLLVDKPGAAQSEIRIGRIGAARKTKDYFALEVMNTVLGGSFTSRLNQNLREDKGYTYGAGSGFGYNLLPGPFRAASAVQTDATQAALEEFFKELAAIREPIPDEELTRARNYLALGFPADFQSVRGIAGNLEDIAVYDLPLDYFNGYVDRVLDISQRDVRDVASRYIEPETMLVVVVGDRATIEDGVRALDLGPVRVLSIEDVLGEKPEPIANIQ